MTATRRSTLVGISTGSWSSRTWMSFRISPNISCLVVRRVQTEVRGAFDRGAQVTEARASVGFELTMWPCEGPPSSPTPRQNWRLTNETFLEMVDHTQKDRTSGSSTVLGNRTTPISKL